MEASGEELSRVSQRAQKVMKKRSVLIISNLTNLGSFRPRDNKAASLLKTKMYPLPSSPIFDLGQEQASEEMCREEEGEQGGTESREGREQGGQLRKSKPGGPRLKLVRAEGRHEIECCHKVLINIFTVTF